MIDSGVDLTFGADVTDFPTLTNVASRNLFPVGGETELKRLKHGPNMGISSQLRTAIGAPKKADLRPGREPKTPRCRSIFGG